MANLNIGASLNTITSLTNLPVTSNVIYATLGAASNLSLAAAMYQGQKIDIVVNPTADITLPMPTTTGWYTTFGDTLMLKNGIKTTVGIHCIGTGQYLVSGKSTGPNTNGYDYVDLGLPSGLLWATCNVGATQPDDSGKYFTWGGTTGYYQGTDAANNNSTPYSTSNAPDTLDLAHDAAHVNMGGEWRMATSAEWRELFNNTTYKWIDAQTTNYQSIRLTSNINGETILFPVTGYYGSGTLHYYSTYAMSWTSSFLRNDVVQQALTLLAMKGSSPSLANFPHYRGIPVRGVIDP